MIGDSCYCAVCSQLGALSCCIISAFDWDQIALENGRVFIYENGQLVMRSTSGHFNFLVGIAAAIVLGVAAVFWLVSPGQQTESFSADVIEPVLSARASEGKVLFQANCATCHGTSAAGTDRGPRLIHPIYNPGHHSDAAFVAAAKLGVRQHHWRFGNMPPQPQVSEDQLGAIVRYVRELQLANGIKYQQHHM